MIPRGYQTRLVSRAVEALEAHGQSLCVSPTGSGKTLMLSWLAERMSPRKALVLQHRTELVQQNAAKLQKVTGWPVSYYTADEKSWSGRAVFGMVQTMVRHLDAMRPVDLLVVDEAHRSAARTYLNVIDRAKELNPETKIAGFTATPARGDGKGLRAVFDNCCDQISLHELVEAGFLVKPRTFIVDLPGVAEALKDVRKVAGEYDLDQAGEIMNQSVHNRRVVEEWGRTAGDRQTIVFCSTVDHAKDVADEFQAAGIKAATISGRTGEAERRRTLEAFDAGEIQVLTNVAVLTEGYDSQPVGCVVLLRPCSFKSTMLQMIGRGLRVVDPEQYPGVVKKDCLVLDFGASLATHGDLDAASGLDGRDGNREQRPDKECPNCGASIPRTAAECPICGFVYTVEEEEPETEPGLGLVGEMEPSTDAKLVEVELFKRSPFWWVDLFKTGRVLVASGFDAQVFVVSPDGDTWTALGKLSKERGLKTLAKTSRTAAIAAADDFLRKNETEDAAHKSQRWVKQPATPRQRELLARFKYDIHPMDTSWTKYTTSAHLAFRWNQRAIEGVILS